MTSPASNSTHPPTSKAVLYCFNCGHESPIGGDWNIQQRRGREIYNCPDCGTTITSRPRSSPRATTCDDGHCYCSGD